jgi:hypothetical protein
MESRLIGFYFRIATALFCLGIFSHSPAQDTRSGQISGHVVDITGAAIGKASIYVRRNSPSEEEVRLVAHTDASGSFKLMLAEGGYDVLVTSPGFAATVESVPVLAKQIKHAQWKLRPLSCNFPGMNCDTFQ